MSASALPPDPSNKDAWVKYWQARQDALGIETHGETLNPAEIQFCEKFIALGQEIEWIPTGGWVSTNDFIWLNHGGKEFEQKTTRANYAVIHGRMVDAASRAAKHNVVKERFMIDLRDELLTEDLAHSLEGFNVGRRKYRLTELWVMSAGRLYEINLQT
jgi:hypothetical protein